MIAPPTRESTLESNYEKDNVEEKSLVWKQPGIDTLMTKQTKTLAIRYNHNEYHIINDLLDRCLTFPCNFTRTWDKFHNFLCH